MIRPFLLVALMAAGSAHAQFRLPSFDINKMLDTAKNVSKAVREPDESEEVSIGQDVAARLLGAAPLAADPQLQQYVNRVGRWLALQTERPDLPWHFGVLEAPEVNAFAVPGGTIFVTRGLVQKMASEAELAGVLSHEIVHVLKKHHLKAIQKGAMTQLGADAASTALSSRGGSPEVRNKLISFGTEMYSRGLDKSDELEADRLGVVIAARGGYDAYGLPAVLQKLQAMNASDSSLALMFKTHPAPAERLDALGGMQSLLDAYSAQPQLRERFAAQTTR
jgi:predicted Zn-dependent protease